MSTPQANLQEREVLWTGIGGQGVQLAAKVLKKPESKAAKQLMAALKEAAGL